MQQPPNQKPITYFIVEPDAYQLIITTLAKQPYSQVANVLDKVAAGTRAMFDEVPISPAPKFAGPGGQVSTDPIDLDDDGLDDDPYPGFYRSDEKNPARSDHDQFEDVARDCWWVRKLDAGQKPKAGAKS